jgi:hypothetical protein
VINSVQEGLVKELDSKANLCFRRRSHLSVVDTQTVIIRTFDRHTSTEYWQYAIEKGERVYCEPQPMIWANQKLLESSKPVLINENYVELAKQYGSTGVSVGLPPKSALFVPMIVGDEVRGSVSLQNIEKRECLYGNGSAVVDHTNQQHERCSENARLFDESNRLLARCQTTGQGTRYRE